MGDAIELISDEDGVALIGDSGVIERFLSSEGLDSRKLEVDKLSPAVAASGVAANAGSLISTNSGRWVQLTEKSAAAFKLNPAMRGSEPGLSRAIVMSNGKISHIAEFVNSPLGMLANPVVLAAAGSLLTQASMQQTLDQIVDYLERIDAKVDDILRAQKDGVLADMIGVGIVIDEAMAIREGVGAVSDVTWSKVQGTAVTLARTQAYALRQLDAIAEKLEKQKKTGDVADIASAAVIPVREWIAVLSRCFQLNNALAVLELDRVLASEPLQAEKHRAALRTARRGRRELISRSVGTLVNRMDAAARKANSKVLIHPISAREVVTSSNDVAGDAIEFQDLIGIQIDREMLDAKRWLAAVVDAKDKAIESSVEGAGAAWRFGNSTIGRAKAATGRFAEELAEKTAEWRDADDEKAGEA